MRRALQQKVDGPAVAADPMELRQHFATVGARDCDECDVAHTEIAHKLPVREGWEARRAKAGGMVVVKGVLGGEAGWGRVEGRANGRGGWLVGWAGEWADGLVGGLVGLLVGWLVGWSVVWLVGWLVGWLMTKVAMFEFNDALQTLLPLGHLVN